MTYADWKDKVAEIKLRSELEHAIRDLRKTSDALIEALSRLDPRRQ